MVTNIFSSSVDLYSLLFSGAVGHCATWILVNYQLISQHLVIDVCIACSL